MKETSLYRDLKCPPIQMTHPIICNFLLFEIHSFTCCGREGGCAITARGLLPTKLCPVMMH